ncbi:nitroreductase/quinone reductase family protein [Georgenia sp. SYP-B2076]|uniref:nitroreductase/quinone reductase family protein n=1 Tax=Georgenia sp. SYP-B2076 TaxID=2495881 RepID=UPI000F8E2D8E|nr:nitroreductase/quinone reductase family protein [Georgenia sp. SYP-B2076]
MPADLAFKALNAMHRLFLRTGRVGSTVARMPVLELTTTGRRSGRPHTVILTSPVQDGEALVVVASRGGDDQPPAWLLNLRAHPEVLVALQGGPRRRMRARVATPAERADLWPRITADHRNYAGYQRRTRREIALVLLEPDR